MNITVQLLLFGVYYRFLNWYLSSMDGMKKHLLRQSEPSKLSFLGEEHDGTFLPKMVAS